MRTLPTLTSALLALVLAACGGGGTAPVATGGGESSAPAESAAVQTQSPGETDGGDGDGGGAPPVNAGGGECTVEIGGDETAEFTSQGGSGAVGTDYWFTDEELDAAIEALGGDTEREPNEPVFWTLIINCGFAENPASISLLPGAETTYDDVPFSPGTYPIVAGGALGGEAGPGEFSVLMTYGERSFQVTEAGELDITRFDTSGIEGTFSFGAAEAFVEGDPPEIDVRGAFNFECTGASKCD